MFSRLLGSRARSLVTVLFFLVLVGALTSLAPTVAEVQQGGGDNGAPAGSPSVLAQERLDRLFPGEDSLPAIITVTADTPEATTAAAARVAVWLRQDGPASSGALLSPACGSLAPGDCVSVPGQLAPDGRTALVVLALSGDPASKAFRDQVGALHEGLTALLGDTAGVEVTGPAGIIADTTKAFASGDRVLLLATVLLVLAILLAVYRSPLMALVPLVGVGIAMRLAQGVGALLADAGIIEISSQTASIMTVLLFGVGTDYALIVSARYQEQLAAGHEPARAMVEAMRRVTETIVSSVATIVLAMLALLLCVSPALHSFGPYLALGVASMALVALTFTPALMVLSGRALFWPRSLARVRAAQGPSRVWSRVAGLVVARSRAVVVATAVALGVLSLGLTGYQETFNFLTGFRVATSSAAGQEVLAKGFGPGAIAPDTVLVEGDGVDAAVMSRIADRLPGANPDVASASFRPGADLATGSGGAGRMVVTLGHDPYEHAGFGATDALRDSVRQLAVDAGVTAPVVSVAGEGPTTLDIQRALDRDMRLLLPVMMLIVAVVLALLLRSLLAPVYLVATLMLSYAATMGVTVWFTSLQGDAGIGNRVAVYVLVFLVALGVDYNIFIMARLRQEMQHHPVRVALRVAVERTGGVVSSAGLILAGTFAVLMTQPIRELYQFGLAMAVGILLDTFVVRPLLVPAVVNLLGERALWPQRPRHPVRHR